MAIMKFNKRMRNGCCWIKWLGKTNAMLVFVCYRNITGRYFIESLDGNIQDNFVFINGKVVFD